MLLDSANVSIRTVCQFFGGAFCVGAAMLVASSMEAQNLFVVMDGTNIAELTPDGTQSTFVSGVHTPAGQALNNLAFNSAGNLFVGALAYPSLVNYAIYVYAPDGGQSMFAPAMGQPTALAFDSSGDLLEGDGFSANIYEYTSGTGWSTFASGLGYVGGMAFDRNGNLFVSDQGSNSIVEITPGGVQSTFASGLGLPGGLAFNKTGDLFVADFIPPGNIYEYTPDGVQIASVSVPGIPFALAFNSAGDLFVSVVTSTNNAIVKITPEGTQSIFASGPYGLALAFQPVPQLLAVATNSTLQVTVSMPSPYYSTIIQASTNLVDWVNICTNTPPFTLTNSTATTAPYRFYRARLGP